MKNRGIVLVLVGLLAVNGASYTLAEGQTAVATAEPSAYKKQTFAEQPDIRIDYPVFSDNDALNTLVEDRVRSLVPEDTTGVTIDYDCAVTLLNERFASMVIWGYSNVEGSVHPFNDIATLNVDLTAMKPVTLEDLYDTNVDFETTFFAKAFFPSDPVTSYSADRFAEMLTMQLEDYQTVDPFYPAEQVSFFLKPDGLVLSMPAVHATGNDHFEAQLNYGDIQTYYRMSYNVWEE
jgi:hypothetical protein